MSDPRDVGTPGAKEWHEFQATAAPFRLLAWLLDELDEVAPDYFKDLHARFIEGFSNSDWFMLDDPDYDGAVPIQSYNGRGVTFIDREDAEELDRQLFPHDEPEGDVRYWGWAAVTIGVHSALEHYAIARGADLKRTPLPEAIRALVRKLAPEKDFPADLADTLTLFDETRHALIHHRGTVSQRFIDNVKGNRFVVGERVPLDAARADRFTMAVWRAARILRQL